VSLIYFVKTKVAATISKVIDYRVVSKETR